MEKFQERIKTRDEINSELFKGGYFRTSFPSNYNVLTAGYDRVLKGSKKDCRGLVQLEIGTLKNKY
jgi:hypothetical protein